MSNTTPYRTFEPCHTWRYKCPECLTNQRINPEHGSIENVANWMHTEGYEIAEVVMFPGGDRWQILGRKVGVK